MPIQTTTTAGWMSVMSRMRAAGESGGEGGGRQPQPWEMKRHDPGIVG